MAPRWAFRLDTWVRFIRDVDPHDQVEHPAPCPFIPKGSTGEVIEVAPGSILVHLHLPDKPMIRLYHLPLSECDRSTEAVEVMPYTPPLAGQVE